MNNWNRDEAIALCRSIEAICPKYGCHVALTGGCLYKDGLRKDCDILFYRIRQKEQIDIDELWDALHEIGFVKMSGFGWCFKAMYKDKPVDCFFPEEEQGNYIPNSAKDNDGGEQLIVFDEKLF